MSPYYKPIIIDGVLYETQWNHDHRIKKEKRNLERIKIRSRNKASSAEVRERLIVRARGACEVCRIALTPILNIHHIYPVRLGGAASDRNLVAICPNCHSAIHYVSRAKHAGFVLQRVKRLVDGGYTEMQAELIRLIASHDAHVLEDGTIEPYTDPPERPFVIIDAPDVDPEIVRRFELAYEKREQRIKKITQESPLARIMRRVKFESDIRLALKQSQRLLTAGELA